MANEFFKSPQLGQAQLTDSQKTGLSGEDRGAVTKAQLASKSIQSLHSMGQKIVHSISGEYQDNIKAKNKVQSSQYHPFFQDYVKKQVDSTPEFESYSDEELRKKYLEYSEGFMKDHEDKSYGDTLKQDIEGMGRGMLTYMVKTRGEKHTKIVTDATAESANGIAQMVTSGMIDTEQFKGRIAELQYDATFGLQDPASSNLPFSDEAREKYRANITSKQSSQAILKGLLIQAGNPKNSKMADIMNTKEFRDFMNIDDTNEDYNKSMTILAKKGLAADKVNYSNSIDGFKETLYTSTNQGMTIDIDEKLEAFKASGQFITAQDEHKLRKAFKGENDLVMDTSKYVDGMLKGIDSLANKPPKVREATLERAFSDAIGTTGSPVTIASISANLTQDEAVQHRLKSNLKSGIPLPKSIVNLFNIPAGTDPEKWITANTALQSMSELAKDTGQSITTLIGAEKVGKIRAIANVESNPILTTEQKQEQKTTILDDYSKINSRGYIKPMVGSTVDKDKLLTASRDARRSYDDLEGSRQNFEIMQHYAYINERSGMNGDDAAELAIEQFNTGHTQYENPDGTHVAIPVEHKILNTIGLKMYAKGHPDIAKRMLEQKITGLGAEYRYDRQIGMKKAPDFNVSKAYILRYDGQDITDARFTYEDYTKYISEELDKEDQIKVNSKINRTRQEWLQSGIERNEKKRKFKGSGKAKKFSYGQFDFEFIE